MPPSLEKKGGRFFCSREDRGCAEMGGKGWYKRTFRLQRPPGACNG